MTSLILFILIVYYYNQSQGDYKNESNKKSSKNGKNGKKSSKASKENRYKTSKENVILKKQV